MDWPTVAIILGLLVPLLTGIVSVAISGELYRRHERRAAKFGILQRLVAKRRVLIPGAPPRAEDEAAFFDALNEVFLRFDSQDVRKAVSELLSAVETKPNRDAELFELFTAMCRDLKLPTDDVAVRLFTKPFLFGPRASTPGDDPRTEDPSEPRVN